MKFDSKSYLYGVYCNVFKSFNDSDELFNDMTEILGDFMIYPGSIKEFNDDKTRERGIEFIPTIMDADINIEKYRLNVLGRYNIEARTPYSKISAGDMHTGVIYNGEGKSGYYSVELHLVVNPCVYYYDMDTVECLRDKYNLSNDDIAKLTSRQLLNLGFKPDDKFNYSVEKAGPVDLDVDHYLLHDYNDNIDEFLNRFFDYDEKSL